jgi:hypothetical protein
VTVSDSVTAGDNHRIAGQPTSCVMIPSRSSSVVTATDAVAGSLSPVSLNASSILTLATVRGSSSAVSSDVAGQSLPVVVLEGGSDPCYCSCLCPLSGFDMIAFNGSMTSVPLASTAISQHATDTSDQLTTSPSNGIFQASSATATENPVVALSLVAGTTSSTSVLVPTTTTETPTASIDINTVSLYSTLTVNIIESL